MQILENKLIHWKTRVPEKYALLPKQAVIAEPMPGCYEMVAPWTLDTVKVLRNLGVKAVPSPILKDYPWPGRFRPMKHQRETSAFLTMNQRAFVFNSPGTGKTASCLWAADFLMSKKKIKRVLIVCPLSIMDAAWLRECQQTIIHRRAAIAHSRDPEKRALIIRNKMYQFVIINYDGIKPITDLINNSGFDLVIVDECNSAKTPSTLRWKSLRAITSNGQMLWMLTGTPAAQSPLDAYGLAKLTNPTKLLSFASWRDRTMLRLTQFKWSPRKEAPQLVHDLLQPAIRYTKEMCLDLPPVMTEVRECDMTPQQRKYYELMRKEMMMVAAGEVVTAQHAATLLTKLLQVSAGSVRTDSGEVLEFDCAPRLALLDEVLEETDRKVLIFAPYRASGETIMQHLEKHNVSCAEIHGDVNASERGKLFEAFQNKPDPRVLVIQPQAAAHGVTLTAADTVVFWGPVMSVETYLQCIARADRIGQSGASVTVVHLQCAPIEKKMFKQLQNNVEAHLDVVKLYEEEVKESV